LGSEGWCGALGLISESFEFFPLAAEFFLELFVFRVTFAQGFQDFKSFVEQAVLKPF